MSEIRAKYMAGDGDASDEEMIERALEMFDQAGINPRRLLALAAACRNRRERGYGRVVATWCNGQPELLLEEDSKMWR